MSVGRKGHGTQDWIGPLPPALAWGQREAETRDGVAHVMAFTDPLGAFPVWTGQGEQKETTKMCLSWVCPFLQPAVWTAQVLSLLSLHKWKVVSPPDF